MSYGGGGEDEFGEEVSLQMGSNNNSQHKNKKREKNKSGSSFLDNEINMSCTNRRVLFGAIVLCLYTILVVSLTNGSSNAKDTSTGVISAEDVISAGETTTDSTTTGVSGKVFQGNKIRKYDTTQLLRLSPETPFTWIDSVFASLTPNCTSWGVVTTIHSPTKSMELAIAEIGLCLVIVCDKKTPIEDYQKMIEKSSTKSFVRVLTVEDQDDMKSKGLDIVNSLPWNHFGRKNIGYLYAIQMGATVVFDFDDDNELTRALPLLLQGKSTMWSVADCGNVFNPYPSFVTLDDAAWPRGFPLTQIENASTWSAIGASGQPLLKKESVPHADIGVIQSLANHDPDMDAIWRLTRKLPLNFVDDVRIVLKSGTLSSYNAQATLHYALWGMLLPVSVHGRVSDIWRSYIMQRLMQDVGQVIGFVSPFVKQVRNAHNYQGDFMSEIPLYAKTEALVRVLSEWKSTKETFQGRMVELFVELYERDFIGTKDVELVQRWIRSLAQVQYKFQDIPQ